MKIVTKPIPDKSHSILVWRDLTPGEGLPDDKASYDFCCNLDHIDEDTCEVSRAMGDLDDQVNILIGKVAIKLGYKKLIFHRSIGGPATHWATKVSSGDGFDYYEVDLVEAQKVLANGIK